MHTYDWDDGGGDGNVVDVFMAVMEQYPPKWPHASQPLFSIKAEFKAAAAPPSNNSHSKEASISRTLVQCQAAKGENLNEDLNRCAT